MWAIIRTAPSSRIRSRASPRSPTAPRRCISRRARSRPAVRPSGSGAVRGSPRSNAITCSAQPLTDQTSTLHTLFLTELAVTAIALVLALAGGWWLVRLGLRPLEDVEATADSIAAGNLDQRVPGAEQPTEVGRLARALNVMLERIQSGVLGPVASEARLKQNEQHLRQFVADASHELRTPIAAVSAYAELFERGGRRSIRRPPRIMSGIRTETARMDRLVTDLLHWRASTRACPWNWRRWSSCRWCRRPSARRPPSGPSGRCASGPPVRSR